MNVSVVVAWKRSVPQKFHVLKTWSLAGGALEK
jgi:hypothetical protein